MQYSHNRNGVRIPTNQCKIRFYTKSLGSFYPTSILCVIQCKNVRDNLIDDVQFPLESVQWNGHSSFWRKRWKMPKIPLILESIKYKFIILRHLLSTFSLCRLWFCLGMSYFWEINWQIFLMLFAYFQKKCLKIGQPISQNRRFAKSANWQQKTTTTYCATFFRQHTVQVRN